MRALLFATGVLVTACGAPAATLEPSARERPSGARTPRALLERAEREADAAEADCGDAEEDCPDYGPAIDTLSRLIRAHPDSREATLALEPLGFFLQRSGREEEARAAWLAAVCSDHVRDPLRTLARVPSADDLQRCEPRAMTSLSTFLVWFRLGELLFDEPDLDRARAALARAVSIAPDDRRYADPARYKLAWTLYRMDRFAQALEAFAPLAGSPDAQLRTEAMQYMAIVLAEADWDVDGEDDAAFGLDRPEAQAWLEWAHAPALVLEVATVLFDDARYAHAAAACERFLARWPDHPDAPDARALLERARDR